MSKNRLAEGIVRRPSGAEEGEAACRGRRGGGSASPANKPCGRRGGGPASPAIRGSARGGFTLVEMLVVIAIISVLAGLTLGSVTAARRYADNKATANEIQALTQAIHNYNVQFGDYPPSTLSALKVKANPVNEGSEALVLCLSGLKKGGPFYTDFKEGRLSNTDNDTLAPNDFKNLKKDLGFSQNSPQLFEYTDLWGNPFVYIHNRDYGSKRIQYSDHEGAAVAVQPAKSAKLGTFQAPTEFQIWSFGRNRINENGEGDDIASWK